MEHIFVCGRNTERGEEFFINDAFKIAQPKTGDLGDARRVRRQGNAAKSIRFFGDLEPVIVAVRGILFSFGAFVMCDFVARTRGIEIIDDTLIEAIEHDRFC